MRRAKAYQSKAKRLRVPFKQLVHAANKESNETGKPILEVIDERLRIAKDGFDVILKYVLM